MQIHSFHALTSQSNQNMWQTPKNGEETNPGHILAQFSLRLKGLTQARGFPRSGELLSPRRELEKRNNGVVVFSRLGETSSPERQLAQHPGGFWCSRLGELYSLGRDYPILSTVHAYNNHKLIQATLNAFSYHHNHHTNIKNTKQN